MFTNEHVRKEQKRRKNGIFLWIGFLVIAMLLFIWGYMDTENTKKPKETYLNNIIESKEKNKTGKLAFLEIDSIPYLFAQYEETGPKYYIVSDSNYLYIVFMSSADFANLNREDIETNHARVSGITKETTMDVKKLAIDAYNEGRDEGETLTLADFENYFGSVYLDMTAKAKAETSDFFYIIGSIFLFTAFIGIIVWAIQLHLFNKKLKKLPEEVRQKLDAEMNDKEAFYYAKAHLYLTEHFIVNFGNTFNFIHYDDIIWIYPKVIKNRGVKTAQSICVMTKDGRTYVIANVDTLTKASKVQYEEIYNTLASKKEDVILGYSKEARKQVKEKYHFKA